ncbi:hypothetical protein [Microcoleus asticus]|uniref:hypothetical protein n=1 Tax=Microcoleus asticus TaxID=2815231 RepID=UPI003BB53F94
MGTLQKTNQRVAAAAVKPAINALWEWAGVQSNVHVDETPWCVMGLKNGYGQLVEKNSVYFMPQIPGGAWNWKQCWVQNLLES